MKAINILLSIVTALGFCMLMILFEASIYHLFSIIVFIQMYLFFGLVDLINKR